MSTTMNTNISAMLEQLHNHPNWSKSSLDKTQVESMLRTEGKSFVVTPGLIPTKEGQVNNEFFVYFLDKEANLRQTVFQSNPQLASWTHENKVNVNSKDVVKVFDHILKNSECPKYPKI